MSQNSHQLFFLSSYYWSSFFSSPFFIENFGSENVTIPSSDGWLPWDPEDISDIRRLVSESMPEKQRLIMESFLDGLGYADIYVTEKYWRYHFVKGIEFLKKELKV